jgi:hypothetical protein
LALALENEDFAASTRQRARNRKSNDSRADHHAVH